MDEVRIEHLQEDISTSRNDEAFPTPGSPTKDLREIAGRYLHAWRGVSGMSQSELARQLKVSRALVNLLDKGKRTPSRDIAEKVVHIFNPPPVEARQFLEAAGIVSPPIQQHISSLLLAVMADDPYNLTVGELARADLSITGGGWQQLVQALATLRVGDPASGRSELERIVANFTLTPILRLVATQRLAKCLRVDRELEAANKLLFEALTSEDIRNVIAVAPHYGELVRALLADEQGVVALRRGYYREAFLRFEKSRADYLGLRNEPAEQINVDAAHDIGRLGLALSAQRLAEAAMFLELDVEANEYCREAEAYLSTLRDFTEKGDALRRIVELRAWGYARAQQYDKAIMLHKEAVESAVQARDRIDEIKNWAYLGDDWWHKVESAIEEAYVSLRGPNGLPITMSSGRVWSDQVVPSRGQVEQWLVEAEHSYATARDLQKRYTHTHSFGHILRGLASILRLQQQYFEANAVLIQAEQHERAHKLESRLPMIFEVRADLYWDQGMPELAERWYQSALVSLQRVLTTWRERQGCESGALAGHILRIERKLRRLELTIASSSSDRGSRNTFARNERLSSEILGGIEPNIAATTISAGLPTPTRLEDTPRQAHEVIHEIRDAVVGTIVRTGRVPIAVSEVDAIWLQELADFERLQGTRILAQNNLSLSLATQPPLALQNADAEPMTNQVVVLYQLRRDAFLSSVYGTQESATPGNITRDLCCRGTIEANADQEDTRDRVREVLRLMRGYPDGYMLTGLNHSMPFGFAVKSSRTLVEIPARFARKAGILTDSLGSVDTDSSAKLYCYRFDDPMLADTLKALFGMLFDLVAHTGQDEPLDEWLLDLVDVGPAGSNVLGI